jgi:uncharacterized protein (DUF2236 family)
MSTRNDLTPHQDYGFFGPDSVTWKVFGYPTALSVGFQRTVVTEMYEPFLLASVDDTEAVMKRPALRYDRTLQYMASIAFHDSRSVLKASDILVKIHTKVVGTEPISGLPYDANDPDAQLWIHLTAWHSVLYTYEKFGPGKLNPRRRDAVLGRVRAGRAVPDDQHRRRAAIARANAGLLPADAAGSGSNRKDPDPRRSSAQFRLDPGA